MKTPGRRVDVRPPLDRDRFRLKRLARSASFAAAVVLALRVASAAALPPAWEWSQEIFVPGSGLAELRLPLATLDRAAPLQEDLRILDATGAEVPYLLVVGTPPEEPRTFAAVEVSQQLQAESLVGVWRVASERAIDLVVLLTPARDLVKAVTVESSVDRITWRVLAARVPVFRQPDGAAQLAVRLPGGIYPYLRVSIDDARERPVPITGLEVRTTARDPEGLETLPVAARLLSSSGGRSRYQLELPGRHFPLHRLEIRPEDPLFARAVTLAERTVSGGEVREKTLGRGRIHRLGDGADRAEVLSLPVSVRSIGARQLVLAVDDGDSPPLTLRAPLVLHLPPVALRFAARGGERYTLVAGNRAATAPRYDLEAVPGLAGRAAAVRASLGPLQRNHGFAPPVPAPGIPAAGGAIDPARWRHARKLTTVAGAVAALEIPPEVLAEAPGLADLRLADGLTQVPYVLDREWLERSAPVALTALPSDRDSRISRHRLELPHPGLPLTDLVCTATGATFQRSVVLYEEGVPGEGGRRAIAGSTWQRREAQPGATRFAIPLRAARRGPLVLEIDEGDNAPLPLVGCEIRWQSPRLLFKALPGQQLALLYGNAAAAPPRYDLALAADEMLAADARPATLAAAVDPPRGAPALALPAGWGGGVFWGVLVLVVGVLVAVIARLLPEGKPPA